jgi:hypothetical protein
MQGRVLNLKQAAKKQKGILVQVYRHNIVIVVHGTVFHECGVITQLSIANGEPLVDVAYGD